MDKFLGAVQLGLNGVSNFLNFSSQRDANEINQANFVSSFAEQRRQFERTLKYNSEVEQVRRLRAAGLNPALVGLGGSSASAGSPPSESTQQPVTYGNFMDGVTDSLLLHSQIDKNTADAQSATANANLANSNAVGQNIRNLYEDTLQQRNILGMDVERGLKQSMLDLNALQLKFDKRSFSDRLRTIAYQADYQRALRDSVTITNQYLPQRLKAEIGKIIAEESAAYINGQASLKQAHAAIMSATNQQHAFDAQFGGNKDDRAKFFEETLKYLVAQRQKALSDEWRNQFFPEGWNVGKHGIGYQHYQQNQQAFGNIKYVPSMPKVVRW